MKTIYQVAFALLFLILTTLAPASAYAAGTSGSMHTHSQTYHDRTPRVHFHASHPHR